MSHPGYLHSPLQMFGPKNGVAQVKSYGMLILWMCDVSPPGL